MLPLNDRLTVPLDSEEIAEIQSNLLALNLSYLNFCEKVSNKDIDLAESIFGLDADILKQFNALSISEKQNLSSGVMLFKPRFDPDTLKPKELKEFNFLRLLKSLN